MAVFTDILPPPQSVDSLDDWGSIDGLLWSLDSPVWNSAGKYGLEAEEGALSGQGGLEGWVRIRTEVAVIEGSAHGEAKGNVVLDLSLSGHAVMHAEHIGGVARAIPVSPVHGTAGESVAFTRTRDGRAEMESRASGGMSFIRIRTDRFSSPASGGDEIVPWRVRLLEGSDDMAGGEAIFPEYKGWTWKAEARAPESIWAGLQAHGGIWRPVYEGRVTWRGAVQWQ